MLVFCGKSRCTSKGFVERETSFASLEREWVTIQGSSEVLLEVGHMNLNLNFPVI